MTPAQLPSEPAEQHWVQHRSGGEWLVVRSPYENALDEIRSQIQRGGEPLGGLPGRGTVHRLALSLGNAVFRPSLRGGFVGRFLTERQFLNTAHFPRPIEEVMVMDYLFRNGVSVPEPLAAVVRLRLGALTYEGGVLTREIPLAENLLDLAKRHDPRVPALSLQAGHEARAMLAYNIFHTDLHPGNVLTSPSALVLIDFDKSYRFVDTEREAMRARSIQRWMRSAEKHGVGDALSHFIRGITEGESAARSES